MQITQSRLGEVVTKNTDTGLTKSSNRNENNSNPLSMNNWRASLVPAAAVIPAPIAYIKVVAVKKLVVGFRGGLSVHRESGTDGPPFLSKSPSALHCSGVGNS